MKNNSKKSVNVTHPEMTRFNITLEEYKFCFSCIEKMWGEDFVPKIPSYKVTDVVKAINPKAKINITGIRPGEKKHEEMISIDDAKNTLEFKDYFVIVPKSKFLNWNKKKYMKSHKNCKNCKGNFFIIVKKIQSS